jgi:hypothetical protein
MDLHGDSAQLRSHGAQLRNAADDVARIADLIDQRAEDLHFQGPAAERFRAEMRDRTARLRRVGGELGDVAQIVTGTATD